MGAGTMLLLQHLKDRQNNPPTFLDFLCEIRAEEEHEGFRNKINTRVQRLEAHEGSTESTLQEPKFELRFCKRSFLL